MFRGAAIAAGILVDSAGGRPRTCRTLHGNPSPVPQPARRPKSAGPATQWRIRPLEIGLLLCLVVSLPLLVALAVAGAGVGHAVQESFRNRRGEPVPLR